MKTLYFSIASVATAAALLTLTAPCTLAANMTPVALTGFNWDVIVENTSPGPPYTTASELNPGEGNAFYQSGLPATSYGLPVSGSFTSAVGDGTVFQFQPCTAKNALVLNTDTGVSTGTLTLAADSTIAIRTRESAPPTLRFGSGGKSPDSGRAPPAAKAAAAGGAASVSVDGAGGRSAAPGLAMGAGTRLSAAGREAAAGAGAEARSAGSSWSSAAGSSLSGSGASEL